MKAYIALILFVALFVASLFARARAQGYISYFSGDTDDVAPSTKAALLLVGGGEDRVDAMRWLLGQGAFGDVVVLRTGGADGYNDWLMNLGAHSVESLVITSRAGANSGYVQSRINHAEIIFIAGGDQSTYVNLWRNTALQAAVNDRVNRQHVPLGGTSAGLAVLGDYIFSAQRQTIHSPEALANPYDPNVTLEPRLFAAPYMNNVITDSHFDTVDRMGRLLTFLARLQQDGIAAAPRGIGIDESAAIAIDADGTSQLFAEAGNAYFLTAPKNAYRVCAAATSLSLQPVTVHKMTKGSSFDFASWRALGGTDYTLSVDAGKLVSSSGGIY